MKVEITKTLNLSSENLNYLLTVAASLRLNCATLSFEDGGTIETITTSDEINETMIFVAGMPDGGWFCGEILPQDTCEATTQWNYRIEEVMTTKNLRTALEWLENNS